MIARKDGESRLVTWSLARAGGVIPVNQYNIYRTFTPSAQLDITRLSPVANISSTSPREWKDNCRTEAVSVRYAVAIVDLHTKNIRTLQHFGTAAACWIFHAGNTH